MPKLSECAVGRDNNFNLMRLLAAYGVLLSHSYPLTLGPNGTDPIQRLTGITLGSIAVDIFFVTSGYLVTKSLVDRKRLLPFLWARILRIYPALIVAVSGSIIVLWALFSPMPLSAFLQDAMTISYFTKNVTLVQGVAFSLPGIFAENPYPHGVNGSLWTLPYEIRLYLLLAFIWVLTLPFKKWRLRIFCALIATVAVVNTVEHLHDHFALPSGAGEGTRFRSLFFTGAMLFLIREWVFVSGRLAAMLVAAIACSAIDQRVFFVTYYGLLPMSVIVAAHCTTWLGRQVNGVGDYSYGIYIYAFPVQQTVAALMPGISVSAMMVLASIATGTLAIASWHLVEKKALTFKTGAPLSRDGGRLLVANACSGSAPPARSHQAADTENSAPTTRESS